MILPFSTISLLSVKADIVSAKPSNLVQVVSSVVWNFFTAAKWGAESNSLGVIAADVQRSKKDPNSPNIWGGIYLQSGPLGGLIQAQYPQ